jgi:peptidoglycan hydrolase CwlO-like protein
MNSNWDKYDLTYIGSKSTDSDYYDGNLFDAYCCAAVSDINSVSDWNSNNTQAVLSINGDSLCISKNGTYDIVITKEDLDKEIAELHCDLATKSEIDNLENQFIPIRANVDSLLNQIEVLTKEVKNLKQAMNKTVSYPGFKKMG